MIVSPFHAQGSFTEENIVSGVCLMVFSSVCFKGNCSKSGGSLTHKS